MTADIISIRFFGGFVKSSSPEILNMKDIVKNSATSLWL